MPPTPATPPKRTRAYTTTSGERVTKFNDGTETRVSTTPTTTTPVPPPTTDIPVAAIDGGTSPVQMPPTPTLPKDTSVVTEAKAASERIAQEGVNQAQANFDKENARTSDTEQRILQLMGIANTEGARRTQEEEARGVNQYSDSLRQLQETLLSQSQELDQFDLDNVNTIEQMRVEGSRKDITKRTFNAQSAEANLQMAVQRAGKVATARTTLAQIESTRGNLEQATEQVDKALKAIYEPVRQALQMEQFFLQRNDKRFDFAQQELSKARQTQIDRQFAEIDRAQSLSDSAVMSGYAGAEEIKQLTALSGDPVAQAAYAQGIVAQGAREMMALERMAKNASISASGLSSRKSLMDLALAGDLQAISQLGFDPGAPIRAKEAVEQDKILSNQISKQDDIIDRLTKVSSMTSAIKSSTGAFQNSFLRGLLPETTGETNVEGVGTINTGRMGSISGGLEAMQDKAAFLTEMNYLLAGEGFQQFSKLKEEGVNLTPVSELEFNKIMGSANMLSSAAQMKDGKIVGFGNLAPEVVQREINTMIAGAAKIRDEKAAIRAGVPYEELLMLQQSVQTAQ